MPPRGFKSLKTSIPEDTWKKMYQLQNLTNESLPKLISRLIDNAYSVSIEGKDPYEKQIQNLEKLDNSIKRKVDFIQDQLGAKYSLVNTQLEEIIGVINKNTLEMNSQNGNLNEVIKELINVHQLMKK